MGLQPGLTYLLKTRLRSRVRSWFRGLNSWKGRVGGVAGVLLLAGWLASVAASTNAKTPSNPESVVLITPVVMMLVALSNILFSKPDVGIVFPPAEVGLLFSAPIPRRQLLIYRILSQLAATLAVSILFSFFLWQHSTFWVTAFLTGFLAMWFLQLVQMAVAMSASLLQQNSFQKLRRWTVGVVFIAGGWTVGSIFASASGNSLAEILIALRNNPIVSVVSWPLTPFGSLMASTALFPEAAGWLTVTVLFNVACTAGIVYTNCNFLERSLQASERLSARLKRVKSGTLGSSRSGGVYRSRRIPAGWRLGGIGPLAWKQLLAARRTAKGIVRMLIVFGVAMTFPVLMSAQSLDLSRHALSLLLVLSVVFLPQMLRMDFRGDVDRIELLRTLPFHDYAIVVGQLCAPVVVASALQWLVLGAVAIAEGSWSHLFSLAAVFCVPLNILVYEIENFSFLLYPHRTPTAGIADIQSFVRHMFLTLVKMAAVVAVSSIVAFPAAFVFWWSAGSAVATASAAFASALVGELLLLPMVVFAYRRFDSGRVAPD